MDPNVTVHVQNVQTPPPHKRFFDSVKNKKKLIGGIIILLVIIALVGLWMGIRHLTQPQVAFSRTAVLSFQPAVVKLSESNASGSANIIISTKNQPISGVELIMTYDPRLFTQISIDPTDNNMFGKPEAYSLLDNQINTSLGTIMYAIAIQPGFKKKVQAKSNIIAQIHFTMLSQKAHGTTYILFAPGSLVTQFGSKDSILQTATPLLIQF